MAVLPEISKLVDEWASERRNLNHAYEQLQQMFKVTIGSNHPNGSNYSKTLLKLDTNSQLEHYQTQVQNLINKKDEHKTIVGKLIADVDQSERNLNAWIRSDTAEILLGWPN
jgi:flagellar biosynthesis chaperone FliJ